MGSAYQCDLLQQRCDSMQNFSRHEGAMHVQLAVKVREGLLAFRSVGLNCWKEIVPKVLMPSDDILSPKSLSTPLKTPVMPSLVICTSRLL